MTSRLNVLCVDDNEDVVRSAATILTLVGCNVCVATNGPTALTEAAAIHPDVCVLDLTMPQMDGFTLARWLRAQNKSHSPKLIALTGRMDSDSFFRSRRAGFSEYLVKPADPRRLIELVTGKTEEELERDYCPEGSSLPVTSA